MCEPISIGIAIGAATGAIGASITGGDVLKGALMGGAMGGVTGGMGGLSGGGMASSVGSVFPTAGIGLQQVALSAGVSTSAVFGATAIGLATSIGSGLLQNSLTPEYSGYTPISQVAQQQQQFNSQNIATSGSGGRQAAGSLAQAIKRSKQRKLTQGDVSDLSIDTGSFAPTGLQFA